MLWERGWLVSPCFCLTYIGLCAQLLCHQVCLKWEDVYATGGVLVWGCTCGGVYIPRIYLHARWSYRRQFRPLLLRPLSVKHYYFPLFADLRNKSKQKKKKFKSQSLPFWTFSVSVDLFHFCTDWPGKFSLCRNRMCSTLCHVLSAFQPQDNASHQHVTLGNI